MSDIWQCWEEQYVNGEEDAEALNSMIKPIPGWVFIMETAPDLENRNVDQPYDDDIPEDSDNDDNMDDMFDDNDD
jgi:hypothetical protein